MIATGADRHARTSPVGGARRTLRVAAVLAAAALTLLGVGGGPAAAHARLDAPSDLAGEVTDTAGVLGADADRVATALDALQRDTGLQLFVAFVPSFDGLSGEKWAGATFDASGLGDDDALLAVAVEDRRYYLLVDSTLGQDQVDAVRRSVEQQLAQDRWAAAATAAADGLRDAAGGGSGTGSGTGSGAGSGSGAGPLVWGVVAVVGLLVVVWVVRRRRGARGADPARLPVAELVRRAGAALVALDDAVKTSEQELGFAQAQFGTEPTRQFAEVLARAKEQLTQGFALRQQLADAQPEDDAQARAMATQILDLCRTADEQLDAQAEEFDRLRDLQARAPEVLEQARTRAGEVASRLEGARATLASLATTYPAAALSAVAANPDQARALLDGARTSAEQGLAAVATDRAAAVALARAAEDAVEQAVRLLDAVDHARADLAEAGGRVDAGLASLGSDLADVSRLAPSDPAVAAAAQTARQVVAEATAARQGGDLLTAVRRLTEAEAALDAALAPVRAEADRLERARTQLATTLGQVASQVRSVADFIETRRGAVGADARTRLAEAARLAQEAERVSATDPVTALAQAQQAGQHAAAAQQLAEADVRRWQAEQDQLARRAQQPGGSTTSMVLGGILLDQLLGGGRGGSRGGRGGGGLGSILTGGSGGGPRRSAPRSSGSFGGGGTRARRGGGGRF